jgi:hypothetical protein
VHGQPNGGAKRIPNGGAKPTAHSRTIDSPDFTPNDDAKPTAHSRTIDSPDFTPNGIAVNRVAVYVTDGLSQHFTFNVPFNSADSISHRISHPGAHVRL